MTDFDIVACENKIGYTFKDKDLLIQCFTHSSYANENGTKDNERLEHFGDAIIEFVVTEYLYNNNTGDEGKLTDLRKNIVSEEPLLSMIRKMGLNDYILLGVGQKNIAKGNEKFYSSLYETVVAGIYIDGGLEKTKEFIYRTLIAESIKGKKYFSAGHKEMALKNDSRNILQEYVQKNKLGDITYKELERKGPDHQPVYKYALLIDGRVVSDGTGSSIKDAKSQAAEKALEKIKNDEF